MTIPYDDDVPQLTRHASGTAPQATVQHDPAPNASPEGVADEVVDPLPCAVASFTPDDRVGVVVQRDGATDLGGQSLPQRHVSPRGKIRALSDETRGPVQHARSGETDASRLA